MSRENEMSNTTFAELGVSPEILRNLRHMQFHGATPVQSKAIGPFLRGSDLLVEAPTGTGKTCAFGIPIVPRLDPAARAPQALIISPTRELALQITAVLLRLGQNMPTFRVAAIYGGENISRQFAALRQRPQIIVATPGRLADHLDRGTIRLDEIRTVVLDEADRMLDMGFRRDLNRIMERIPKERQTAMFSATLSSEILDVAKAYQRRPETIRVDPGTATLDAVRQYVTEVQTGYKNVELFSLLESGLYPLSLVFVRTKRRAASLAITLAKRGLHAGALHGNMSQPQRDRVMRQYRQGELDILVATDIAARGLDVQNINAVINYDLPEDRDAYTHRIGRTGRAQQRGVALTFVEREEFTKLRQIISGRQIEMIPSQALAAAQ